MQRSTRSIVCVAAAIGAGLLLLKGARQPDPTGVWIAAGTMTSSRNGACSASLPDGRVLITGGTGSAGALASAEVFSADGSFSAVAPMADARSQHACAAFEEGRVLVAGGSSNGGTINVAEIYGEGAVLFDLPRSGQPCGVGL